MYVISRQSVVGSQLSSRDPSSSSFPSLVPMLESDNGLKTAELSKACCDTSEYSWGKSGTLFIYDTVYGYRPKNHREPIRTKGRSNQTKKGKGCVGRG